jgi:hypothetical protein
MTTPTATQQKVAHRLDRIVRSLVGVADLAPSWRADGRLLQIDILTRDDVQEHQLVRNVVSGLGAACGISLDRSAVRVHGDVATFARASAAAALTVPPAATPAATPAADVPAPIAAPAAAAHPGNGNGTGHHAGGNGHHGGNGNGIDLAGRAARLAAVSSGGATARKRANGAAAGISPRGRDARRQRAADEAASVEAARIRARSLTEAERAVLPAESDEALRLEGIHVERHGPLIRCRVTLELNTHRYSAIADTPDSPTAEAELAARVTLDALRAGALTAAAIEGVGSSTIGETTYVVVSLRDPGTAAAYAGTAPLRESMARAAALAVLDGIGPITTSHREAAERELSRL